ncbi:MAG TPA: glycosyltransferase family 1 protein [Patescibacteria group bacterium]|nr:glycosyltransferase family 1 protein [Patescibacteria group bacterium]
MNNDIPAKGFKSASGGKIGIDARLFGTKHRGIGRYTQNLIESLEKIDRQNDYVVFMSCDNFDDYQPKHQNFKKVVADFKAYSWQEQLLFPRLIKKYKLDLIHFTHFNVPLLFKKRFIVTIHDLIITHHPDSRATTLSPILYKIKLFFYGLIIKSTAKRADKIITVSQYSKKDIIHTLGASADKIFVTYEGIDAQIAIKENYESILSKFNLTQNNYLLYIGSAYPHKNLERLISAFDQIIKSRDDLKLVLVGKKDFFYTGLEKYIKEKYQALSERIVITDYLSDHDLSGLYQGASCYVFPSLIEGFGLPPLEAQKAGLAVVSSNTTCLPEILSGGAIYFDPNNSVDIADKIKIILSDDNLRQDLIKRGYENADKYSWEKCAQETLGLY